jgi:uncharacterized protein (TIGR03663 family)
MAMLEDTPERKPRWLDQVLGQGVRLDGEVLVFILLVVVAIVTRFYMLDARVMSHDETSHVYYSWNLFRGLGFQHNPLMHGPFQFILLALNYFLFGVTDGSARIPAAVSGVIAVVLLWLFRRWLGKTGTLAAAALMVVSPYMLFYSRYVRNEAFVVVEGLLLFWAVFRYYETRQARWLYLLAASLALHFATKETAFIYAAQLLLFLGGVFVWQILRARWERPIHKVTFIVGLGAAVIGVAVAGYFFLRVLVPTTKAVEQGQVVDQALVSTSAPPMVMGVVLAAIGAILIVAALVSAFGKRLRTEFPTLDLLVVSGTLTLTQLMAVVLPAETLARYGQTADPQSLLDPAAVQRLWIAVPVFLLVAAAVGLAWDRRRWLIAAGVFAALYVPFYTTMFTHALGLATGSVGSLAYWLGQQGVERGSQPWYYFILVQIPIYEFLPAIGAIAAGVYGIWRLWSGRHPEEAEAPASVEAPAETRPFNAIAFLGYWTVTSLVLFSYAGEKMPWLTVHIALAMILVAGWAFGKFFDSVDWGAFRRGRSWLVAALVGLALVAAIRATGYLLGPTPPFRGSSLEQIGSTTGFLAAFASAVASAVALFFVARNWSVGNLAKLAGVLGFGGLFLLTTRAAFRASYVNYDDASEYLLYAHCSSGPKIALQQIIDISLRTTGGLAIDVGYDNETSYPYMWYLRDFPNTHPFGEAPGRDLINYPIILAGDANWPRVDAVLGDRYYTFDYIRMWWPMEEYRGLTWERISNAILSPEYRAALWDIWLNRDYTAYGALTGVDYSLEHWQPSARLRLYVRKDIAALLWDYSALPSGYTAEPFVDPYAEGMTSVAAELIVDLAGAPEGRLNAPRGMDVAPDGTIYVADTGSHRIVHLTPEGAVVDAWGTFADINQGDAPGGTFNEPWDVAVAPDGSVYVADTWNHRVQHFSAGGQFLGMFGTQGQGETLEAFWGPRAVVVDAQGRVYVADTGNKRIVVFNANGEALTTFGGPGFEPGNLNEPVGLALAEDGTLFVADTWNMRIQAFREDATGSFQPVGEWLMEAWYGQSLNNKPYLAVGPDGQVCTSDPEGFRILCFTSDGTFTVGWGGQGIGPEQFGMPVGVAFDAQGELWVVDTGNNRLMRFAVPAGEALQLLP